MKVKKVAVKKYAEGVSSTETSKPKKMNFVSKFINRQREKEAANHAGLEAEEQAEVAATAPKYNITQEKSFVGPQLTGLDKAINTNTSDDSKLDSASGITKTTKTNLTKGADAKLAAWQSKRGLVADGIWGAKSEEAYKKEQAAKPKKMAIKKTVTPEVTKTEVVATKPTHTPAMATGRKGSDGNVYFSNGRTYNPATKEKGTVGDGSIYSDKAPTTRTANADMKAWGDATSKKKIVTEKEDTASKAARLEKQYGDEGGLFGVSDERVKKQVDIEKKGDEATLKTLGAVGLGGAALTGAALALNAKRKNKSAKASTVKTNSISSPTSKYTGVSYNQSAPKPTTPGYNPSSITAKKTTTLSSAGTGSKIAPKKQPKKMKVGGRK